MLVTAVVVGFATRNIALYSLYTHCGVRYADLGDRRYYAVPLLDDGNGNPPAGWGNPSDAGMLIVTGSDTVTFVDLTGNKADFAAYPRTGVPLIEVCS